jgi:hypothetical protein
VTALDEELRILDMKLRQLKVDYEHYFLGRQPREPIGLRSEVQKQFVRFSGMPIRNTAARFRFNSLNARFQAMKRQWDATLRQIESGTYKRHVFKAKLHEQAGPSSAAVSEDRSERLKTLFESYREAAQECGQNVDNLTPAVLQAAIARQEAAVRKKLGCDEVEFRVVVSGGKVKLKASARRR